MPLQNVSMGMSVPHLATQLRIQALQRSLLSPQLPALLEQLVRPKAAAQDHNHQRW